jgi:SAM-dependent methyltransferase
MKLIELLKKLPIDLGQGNKRVTTQGKKIALAYAEPDRKLCNKALDVGCREGIYSNKLEKRGFEVTSIDIEPQYDKALKIDVQKPLPFENESFDLVWCSEVIEHLRNPAFSVSEMRRVLKPGGKLIVTTPNSGAWFFRILKCCGVDTSKLQNEGHMHFFDIDDVKSLFPHAKILGYFPYLLWKPTIKRFVGLLTPTFVVVEEKS